MRCQRRESKGVLSVHPWRQRLQSKNWSWCDLIAMINSGDDKGIPWTSICCPWGLDRHSRQKYRCVKILNIDMICFHVYEVHTHEINRCIFKHQKQRKHFSFSLHFVCLPPLNQQDELKGQCWLQSETHILHIAKQEQFCPAMAGAELSLNIWFHSIRLFPNRGKIVQSAPFLNSSWLLFQDSTTWTRAPRTSGNRQHQKINMYRN